MGLILLIMGIKDKDIAKLVLGILCIFYYTYKKTIYLTDEGVLFTYKGFLFNKKDLIDKKHIQEVLVVKQELGLACILLLSQQLKR